MHRSSLLLAWDSGVAVGSAAPLGDSAVEAAPASRGVAAAAKLAPSLNACGKHLRSGPANRDVIRCIGRYAATGKRCGFEALPGSVVCATHGGSASPVQRRAAERVICTAVFKTCSTPPTACDQSRSIRPLCASRLDTGEVVQGSGKAGAVTFVRNAFACVRPGGMLITGNMLDTHPQLGFTMDVIQWPHIQPRSTAEMLDIFEAAGIRGHVDVHLPSDGVYAVYVLRKD